MLSQILVYLCWPRSRGQLTLQKGSYWTKRTRAKIKKKRKGTRTKIKANQRDGFQKRALGGCMLFSYSCCTHTFFAQTPCWINRRENKIGRAREIWWTKVRARVFGKKIVFQGRKSKSKVASGNFENCVCQSTVKMDYNCNWLSLLDSDRVYEYYRTVN